MMGMLAALLLLAPVICFGDFRLGSKKFDYIVYDESITSISDHEVVFYQRYTEKKKKDNSFLVQNLYNCETKYLSIRGDESEKIDSPQWMSPDARGRFSGEYACEYIKLKNMTTLLEKLSP